MPYDNKAPYNDLPALPPPGIDLETPEILRQLVQATRYLGELNGLCEALPDPRLLTNAIVLQESQASSAIENIVTTQDELYQAEAGEEVENQTAKEVLSYRQALYTGLERMIGHHHLITVNTMVEIVQTIKQNQAGIRNIPGTALKSAINGQVIYTPPCCEEIIRGKLQELEQFINDPAISPLDPHIKLAMIHYQFEAIHPFADGNGRTGRIINSLYLAQQGLLTQPVLYLSSYIVKFKTEYYQLLRGVTETNNWRDWIMYMVTAISETSRSTSQKIRSILTLKEEMEISMRKALGSSFQHDLLQLLFASPYVKIETLERKNMAHRQTASVWLKKLSDAGILHAQKKGRTIYFINHRLMDILSGRE